MKEFSSKGSDRMSQLFRHSGFHCLLIATFSAVMLFGNLHKGDLSGYDDAAYAHEGKEMLLSGNWMEVRLNGYLNFDKPPLFVWCEAAAMKIFGVSDFAAKLPSALFGFGTILLVYFLSRQMTDRFWLPIIAMLVMTTTQYFMKYAMHAMTCVPFTFFFALAIFGYLKAREHQRYWLLCGIATGLATLTRSPVGLIPLFIVGFHLIWTRHYGLLRSKGFLGCLAIALLLPGMWYGNQYQRYGSRFLSEHYSNLVNHAVAESGAGHKREAARFTLGLLEYPYLLLKLYWPWLPFMLSGFLLQLRKMVREREAVASLLVLWILGVIGPFSLADAKVLRYILAAFPALAIVSALALEKYIPPQIKVNHLKVIYSLFGIAVFAKVAVGGPLVRARDMRTLAPVAERATGPGQRILLYNFGDTRADFRSQLIWYGNRLCEQTTDLNEIRSRLAADPQTVVILDKAAFASLANGKAFDTHVLGESENFVCVRRGSS